MVVMRGPFLLALRLLLVIAEIVSLNGIDLYVYTRGFVFSNMFPVRVFCLQMKIT